jgi:hypothetical protein
VTHKQPWTEEEQLKLQVLLLKYPDEDYQVGMKRRSNVCLFVVFTISSFFFSLGLFISFVVCASSYT